MSSELAQSEKAAAEKFAAMMTEVDAATGAPVPATEPPAGGETPADGSATAKAAPDVRAFPDTGAETPAAQLSPSAAKDWDTLTAMYPEWKDPERFAEDARAIWEDVKEAFPTEQEAAAWLVSPERTVREISALAKRASRERQLQKALDERDQAQRKLRERHDTADLPPAERPVRRGNEIDTAALKAQAKQRHTLRSATKLVAEMLTEK